MPLVWQSLSGDFAAVKFVDLGSYLVYHNCHGIHVELPNQGVGDWTELDTPQQDRIVYRAVPPLSWQAPTTN